MNVYKTFAMLCCAMIAGCAIDTTPTATAEQGLCAIDPSTGRCASYLDPEDFLPTLEEAAASVGRTIYFCDPPVPDLCCYMPADPSSAIHQLCVGSPNIITWH